MTGFIRGEFEGTGQKWVDDPANAVIDRIQEEFSDELGTDGPEETFGHPDESVVGRLVEDDAGTGPDLTREAVAHDSHDATDLSAEESAIHMVEEDDDTEVSDPDITDDVRAELRNY